jgi:glyoxylase-like metal-dependent hydrolase (beta-lactamase superfamily II)
MTSAFEEIADRVFVLRYPVLDVNVTLVVGDGGALVVDTLSTEAQGRELLDAVRVVTGVPLTVAYTHHHFDHCFGTACLAGPDTAVWAQIDAAGELIENGPRAQREWYERLLPTHPDLAEGLATATIVPPDHTVRGEIDLDIGGRTVRLAHFGRGHTIGDLMLRVPDADVLVAGDLVESSGPPMFEDSYPLEWPETLGAAINQVTPSTVVVPGHGPVVDVDFLIAQHGQLSELDWLIRAGHADGATVESVAAQGPFGAEASIEAVRRGFAELDGRA